MSADRPEGWHEGHGAGYLAALEDVEEWLTETIAEWRDLKIVDDHQAIALLQLLYDFDIAHLYERITP